ncbi:hypothetical protein [Capybara microvirus Cap3_SP_316]|nr:hypothetical protein [Capybara microvirus Cap3_SP_316]
MTTDKLFYIYDTVSDLNLGYRFYPTIGALIRSEAPTISKQFPNFETELKIIEIGSFVSDSGYDISSFNPLSVLDIPLIHSWDEYSFQSSETKFNK